MESDPVTGGMMLELIEIEGAALPSGRPARKGKRVARLPARSKPKLTRKKPAHRH